MSKITSSETSAAGTYLDSSVALAEREQIGACSEPSLRSRFSGRAEFSESGLYSKLSNDERRRVDASAQSWLDGQLTANEWVTNEVNKSRTPFSGGLFPVGDHEAVLTPPVDNFRNPLIDPMTPQVCPEYSYIDTEGNVTSSSTPPVIGQDLIHIPIKSGRILSLRERLSLVKETTMSRLGKFAMLNWRKSSIPKEKLSPIKLPIDMDGSEDAVTTDNDSASSIMLQATEPSDLRWSNSIGQIDEIPAFLSGTDLNMGALPVFPWEHRVTGQVIESTTQPTPDFVKGSVEYITNQPNLLVTSAFIKLRSIAESLSRQRRIVKIGAVVIIATTFLATQRLNQFNETVALLTDSFDPPTAPKGTDNLITEVTTFVKPPTTIHVSTVEAIPVPRVTTNQQISVQLDIIEALEPVSDNDTLLGIALNESSPSVPVKYVGTELPWNVLINAGVSPDDIDQVLKDALQDYDPNLKLADNGRIYFGSNEINVEQNRGFLEALTS